MLTIRPPPCAFITGATALVSRIGPVIALLLIEALRDPFARRKIDALEMSWILETNTGMNNMLERIGAEPYKRYRLYEKQI